MDYAFDTRCASGRAMPRGVSPTASCASSTCRTCTGSSTGRLDCLSGATEEGAGEVCPREASAGFTRRVMAMTEVISDCDFSGISDCDGNCGESVMVTLVIFLILCNRVTCREKAAGSRPSYPQYLFPL